MPIKLSHRLSAIIDALPLENGLRILEIGCGTGAAAREISRRFDTIYVLGIDRSSKAIAQAISASQDEIDAGKLNFLHASIETLELSDGEKFDFAFAIRVGALDGRHPEMEAEAISKISQLLKPNGKLYIDGGNPLKQLDLKNAKR